MQTLTYGFQKPETGDKGSVFWEALEENIQQLNDHTHNGSDSAQLTPAAMAGQTQSVAASWTSVGNGLYRQLITMPGTLQFDDVSMRMYITNGDDANYEIYPSILKVTANTFYIYVNDNTLTLKVIYR